MNPMHRPSRALRPGAARISVSFEMFPPKNDAMAVSLFDTVDRLSPLQPSFISVTCGAGGSTTSLTASTVAQLVDSREARHRSG